MARLKTKKYEFGNEEVSVNFNCSTSGVFSSNLPYVIQDKLNLQGRLEFSSLKQLEDTIDDAFRAYKKAKTAYKLVIAICFGASGEFKKKLDGELNEKFFPHNSNHYTIHTSMHSVNSVVGFDYRVLIEENRDGKINYHKANHISYNPFNKTAGELNCLAGEYYSSGNTYIRQEERLIPYSDEGVRNLESIYQQLRKASSFLIDLVTNEQLDLLINSKQFNLLT